MKYLFRYFNMSNLSKPNSDSEISHLVYQYQFNLADIDSSREKHSS